MASINKVILVCALGKDPEVRQTQAGSYVCNLSAATSRKYKDAQGNAQEETEWHRISLFGQSAEVAGQYLKKGSTVYVEGRLRTRKYTDKEGIDRYVTEIIGENMQFLDRKSQQAATSSTAPKQRQARPVQDEDCPF